MGALTDHRKRSSADLRLHLSPLFPSPTKKPRFPLPSLPPSAPAPPLSHPSMPRTPHPRFIHAPQRHVRAFGLGSPSIPIPRPSKPAPADSPSRKPDEGIPLHEYRKLVEENLASPRPVGTIPRSSKAAPAEAADSRSRKLDEGIPLNEYRKLVDEHLASPPVGTITSVPELKEEELLIPLDVPKKVVVEETGSGDLETKGVSKERVLVKSEPLYKVLYEKAKKHDARLNELGFSVKLYLQKAIGFRNEGEVLRKRVEKPKEDHERLFGPLIDEEEEDISLALFNGSNSKVLVTHESSNIVITREVLQCLRPGAWLNDEVINLYLDLLKEREKREPKKFLKCHFFSTFFYKRLISGKHGYDFKAVKRWTTQRKLGYALSECDKIFVPIHKEIHWCLAVINVKDESLQYLDSLGGLDNYALKMLARYLVEEVKDKSSKTIDTQYWKKESVDDLPLQKNGWDCGMFMLKYADFYSRGLKLCFGQEHMAYFRKRTALEILRLRAE